ncbi:MAG: hypothetical protein HC851_16540 [Acaryochloris sp. RU_4_1]|nr:hypothetical protein [Acaryochloris sp. RU_4_1]NJR55079.1 hypothetical protein [Acaryochloris sp. CRU_2_0]
MASSSPEVPYPVAVGSAQHLSNFFIFATFCLTRAKTGIVKALADFWHLPTAPQPQSMAHPSTEV